MDTDLIKTKIDCLMAGYKVRWADSEWVPESVEQTVLLPVVNPETGRLSRTFKHAGKTDLTVAGFSKKMLMDHKTTSDNIEDPDGIFWRRWLIDSQASKYMLQAWQGGVRLDGFIVDVIRKPTINPRKLTAKEIKEITDDYMYFGSEVDMLDHHAVANGVTKRESYALYALRLSADIAANPDKYYQRRVIHRLDNELVEYANELWQIADEIRRTQNSGYWFKNPDSCMNYNTPCEFLGVCSGHDTIDSDKWERVDCVHTELDIEGDGRDVLTNSSIKTFQSCRRKFKYKYVDGVRRQGDEKEALYFGTQIHESLEDYFNEMMEVEKNGNPSESTETEPVSQAGFSF
jgi:hypothetical protein